jgi:multidrug efflux pump subunit AcrA (membrane-fusion protein)
MMLARWVERLNARPLGVVVFAASVVLLVQLQSTQFGRFRARAVAHARPIEHPVLVTSFIERLHAQPGDLVEPGAPLVELSPHFIERELDQVNGEIEQTRQEARLALAAGSIASCGDGPADRRCEVRPRRSSSGASSCSRRAAHSWPTTASSC